MDSNSAIPRTIVPFASSGAKNTIPVTTADTSAASYMLGFPPLTAIPVESGGVPPTMEDMNGILYDVTDMLVQARAAGIQQWSASFSNSISGYPSGAITISQSKLWLSNVDSNTSTPGADTNWSDISSDYQRASALALASGAGDVGYSDSQTYQPGTVGEKLAKIISPQLSDLIEEKSERETWLPTRYMDWSQCFPGTTPKEFQIFGSATAVVDADGNVECAAPFTDKTKHIRIPVQFKEGRIRFCVKNTGVPWLFGFRTKNDGSGYRVWTSDGTNVQAGYIYSFEKVTPITGNFAIPSGAAYLNVEVEVGVASQGKAMNIRVWDADNGTRPYNSVSGTFPAKSGSMALYNEGFICIETIGQSTAILKSITIVDGEEIPISKSQVAFTGRWFTHYEDYVICMASVRQGSSFRFNVFGATFVNGSFKFSPNTSQSPILAVYVDGVFSSYVTIASQVVTLVSGLDASRLYHIECRIAGIQESDDKWMNCAGVLLHRLVVDTGTVSPWADNRPGILFIGDSITEGVAAKGKPGVSIPENSVGEASYGVLTANYLGFAPWMNGFGATGLTVSGSGGVPPTIQNSMNYMHDRAIHDNPRLIVINIGTNDAGHSVSASNYQTALNDLITALSATFRPSRIYLMRPFNGSYADTISAVATARNTKTLPVKYIDTTGWLSGSDFNDGTHPTPAGHAKAAALLETIIHDDLIAIDLQ